jgi:hypothetical protein
LWIANPGHPDYIFEKLNTFSISHQEKDEVFSTSEKTEALKTKTLWKQCIKRKSMTEFGHLQTVTADAVDKNSDDQMEQLNVMHLNVSKQKYMQLQSKAYSIFTLP